MYLTFKHFLKKELVAFEFSFFGFLSFCMFYSYAFQGAMTKIEIVDSKIIEFCMQLALTAVLTSIFIFFLKNQKHPEINYLKKVKIKIIDLVVFISIFIFMFQFAQKGLEVSLTSDQLYYSKNSVRIGFFFSAFIPKIFSIFKNVEYRIIVQLCNVIIIIISGFWIVKVKKDKLKLFFWGTLFVFFRFINYLIIPNADPHPPMQYCITFLGSTIFGVNDLSFKFSYFCGYITFLFFFYQIINKKFNFFVAYFFTLTVGTVPLLLHLSTIVEQSIWSSIIFTLIMVYVITKEEKNYLQIITCVSIGVMLRQPTFLILFPVFILLFFDKWKLKNKKHFFLTMSPILLFLPFLIKSIILGTPSTVSSDIKMSAFEKVLLAFDSGIIWISSLNSIPGYLIIFLLFCFLPLKLKNIKYMGSFLFFFIVCIFIYYSIDEKLWGSAKYQAEYLIPFIIVGIYFFTEFCISVFEKMFNIPLVNFLIVLMFILLINKNIDAFNKIPEKNEPTEELIENTEKLIKEYGKYYILSELNYKYKEAFAKIKKLGLAGNTYNLGYTYGWFGEVMSGYTIEEIYKTKKIVESVKWESGNLKNNLEQINNNEEIKAVLMGFVYMENKKKILSKLLETNWRIYKVFEDEEYGSKNYLLIRKNLQI